MRRVEYIDDPPARPERGGGRGKIVTALILVTIAFVVTGVLVLTRRMSDETLYLIAGIVIGLVPGGLLTLINSGVIGRRVSALEASLQHQRERRPGAGAPAGAGPGSVFVVTSGGVERQRMPARQGWYGSEDFEPAPREFHVVGSKPGGSGRGAGGQGRG